MYEVYINETPFRFVSTEAAKSIEGNAKNLVARYPGRSKFLLNYIDLLEKGGSYDSITIYWDDVEFLIETFEGLFKIIEAAGGLVFNPKDEILVMLRRGFWDLPKGKIEKGETREQAAVREVQEETGLETVELGKLLCTTRHTYRNRKNKRVLKPTYWYYMKTSNFSTIPQTEEDIEKIEWAKLNTFVSSQPKIYKSILHVLQKFTEVHQNNTPFNS